MIVIKNDILDEEIFNKLHEGIVQGKDDNLPWYTLRGAAYNGQNVSHKKSTDEFLKYDFSFFHLVVVNGKPNSRLNDVLTPLVYEMLEKANIEIKELIRIRLGLLPICPINFVHGPHVDLHMHHKTAMYYFNTTDGDTFLYNEKYDPDLGLSSADYYTKVLKSKVTVKKRITPKANRFMCFDGTYFHSGSSPVEKQARYVMNVNFL